MDLIFKKGIFKVFTKKKVQIFPVTKSIHVSESFAIGRYRNIQVHSNCKLTILENVFFREFCNILIFEEGKLTINKNVFFNNYCSINCLHEIEIGENTIFGEGVKLYDHNHKYNYEQEKLVTKINDYTTAPIKIGKNCWIASNVTILKGVEIGDNVIVGANTLVFKSIPSNSIVKSNHLSSGMNK